MTEHTLKHHPIMYLLIISTAFLVLQSSKTMANASVGCELQAHSTETWSGIIIINETKTVHVWESVLIEPGTVVKLCENTSINVRGRLIAEGEEDNMIIFTHNNSNEHWGNINFEYPNTGSILKYCSVEYGDGIRCKDSSPIISYCIISKNRDGISLYESSSLITHNTLSYNYNSGILCRASPAIISYNNIFENNGNGITCIFRIPSKDLPKINYNNIYNNSGYGINADDSTLVLRKVNATHNWWGSIDGPSGIASGSGDEVSKHVDYSEWETKEIGKDDTDTACKNITIVSESEDSNESCKADDFNNTSIPNNKNDQVYLNNFQEEKKVIPSSEAVYLLATLVIFSFYLKRWKIYGHQSIYDDKRSVRT